MKDLRNRSEEELEDIIQKAYRRQKLVEEEIALLLENLAGFQYEKSELDSLLQNAKSEKGRRKAVACGVKKVKTDEYGDGYSYECGARELKPDLYSTENEFHRRVCHNCKWTPEQAQTRAVILRIKNGKK